MRHLDTESLGMLIAIVDFGGFTAAANGSGAPSRPSPRASRSSRRASAFACWSARGGASSLTETARAAGRPCAPPARLRERGARRPQGRHAGGQRPPRHAGRLCRRLSSPRPSPASPPPIRASRSRSAASSPRRWNRRWSAAISTCRSITRDKARPTGELPSARSCRGWSPAATGRSAAIPCRSHWFPTGLPRLPAYIRRARRPGPAPGGSLVPRPRTAASTRRWRAGSASPPWRNAGRRPNGAASAPPRDYRRCRISRSGCPLAPAAARRLARHLRCELSPRGGLGRDLTVVPACFSESRDRRARIPHMPPRHAGRDAPICKRWFLVDLEAIAPDEQRPALPPITIAVRRARHSVVFLKLGLTSMAGRCRTSAISARVGCGARSGRGMRPTPTSSRSASSSPRCLASSQARHGAQG